MPRRPRLLTIRSLCLLLTALLLTSGLGSLAATTQPPSSSPTPEDVIPKAPETPNILDVQAPAGQILSWEDNDAWATHVRIHGVAPSLAGYTLIGPVGQEVFTDQISRHDGIVEFHYVALHPGLYTVVREAHGIDETVTTFDTATLLGPGTVERTLEATASTLLWLAQPIGWTLDLLTGQAAASNTCASTDHTTAECGNPCHYHGTSTHTRMIDAGDIWSPSMILHSPAGGRAEIETGVVERNAAFLTFHGWKSEFASSGSLEATDGHTVGLYQKLRWGLYETDYYWNCRPMGYTQNAQEIDEAPDGYTTTRSFVLTGESQRTGADDDRRPVPSAISTHHRFAETDHVEDTEASPRGFTILDEIVQSLGGSISFSAGGVEFERIDIETEAGTSHLYEYTLPRGGVYHIDRLDRLGRAMAFCLEGAEGC